MVLGIDHSLTPSIQRNFFNPPTLAECAYYLLTEEYPSNSLFLLQFSSLFFERQGFVLEDWIDFCQTNYHEELFSLLRLSEECLGIVEEYSAALTILIQKAYAIKNTFPPTQKEKTLIETAINSISYLQETARSIQKPLLGWQSFETKQKLINTLATLSNQIRSQIHEGF